MEAFDQIRAGVLADRSQYFKDLSAPFYGANRPNSKVSQGLRDYFWLQGMMCGHKAAYDCIKAFSETDFTEDLKKFDVPTLILHGDDDQIVPIADSAMLSSKLIKGATLKIIAGGPHGMCSTLKDTINAELLAFLQTGRSLSPPDDQALRRFRVWMSRAENLAVKRVSGQSSDAHLCHEQSPGERFCSEHLGV